MAVDDLVSAYQPQVQDLQHLIRKSHLALDNRSLFLVGVMSRRSIRDGSWISEARASTLHAFIKKPRSFKNLPRNAHWRIDQPRRAVCSEAVRARTEVSERIDGLVGGRQR